MAIEEIRRKDGRKSYRAVVRVFRKKVSKTFSRKLDAERWELETLHQRLNPSAVVFQSADKGMTVNGLFEQFSRDYMGIRLAASTRLINEGLYRNYVGPHLGHEPIVRLDTKKVREFFFFLSKERKSSNERVNRVRRLLHCMLNRALEWELVATNPVTPVKQLPSKQYVGDENINFLNQAEVSSLLNWTQARDPWLYSKVRVLVNTGVRYGEMAALQVGDFRRTSTSSVLVVSRTYCRLSYQIRNRTKGNRSRAIPLGEGMEELFLRLSQGKGPKDPLMWSHWEEGKHQTKFNKHFHAALEAAGVRRIRVHDLRHTFAVHFLENGGQLYDLQKILGHHSIQLTERYSHFSLAMAERSRGLVDHHGNPRIIQPKLTVIDGGVRSEMSHKCPTDSEMRDQGSLPVVH